MGGMYKGQGRNQHAVVNFGNFAFKLLHGQASLDVLCQNLVLEQLSPGPST